MVGRITYDEEGQRERMMKWTGTGPEVYELISMTTTAQQTEQLTKGLKRYSVLVMAASTKQQRI